MPEKIAWGRADSWEARKRSTLGAVLVFTSPGIPMIFMGQEFLQTGEWTDAAQLEWDRATRFAGIRRLYRDLIRLRRDWHGTTRGLRGQGVQVHHVNDADKLVGFHRWDRGGPGDDVVVLANCSARAFDGYRLGVPRGGIWRVRFNSDWRGYSPAFGDQASFDAVAAGPGADGYPAAVSLGIGPYSCVILSQDR
jgi:1,4-alpha-glucan branching enzyme